MARSAQMNLRVRPSLKAKLEKLAKKIGARSALTSRNYLRTMLKAHLKSAPSKIVRGPNRPNCSALPRSCAHAAPFLRSRLGV